ncbi:MAG: RecX family transcriptional regulator [Firmicutes bacterium]|nr:RecX family transcriptional regulator [Bacillota bacterium]
MKIYYLRKLKGRIYESESIIPGLSHGENGAPRLEEGYVSVSDTPLHWSACVSEIPVGFDIEEGDRYVNRKTAGALHPLEKAYLDALEGVDSEWRSAFLSIWTAKESYMKFCGEGLRLGASSFSVIGEDMDFVPVVSRRGYPPARLLLIKAPAGMKAALCVPAETESRDASAAGPEGAYAPAGDPGRADAPSWGRAISPEISWEPLDYEAPFKLSALEKAAGYLDIKALAAGELVAKLIKDGYPDEAAAAAVAELRERGYISDEEFSASYARRAMSSGKGSLRIRRELAQKGVDKSVAEQAVKAELEEAELSETDRALAEARRALRGKSLEGLERAEREKLLARAGRKLASLGYETSVIYEVLGRLRGGEEEQ